MFNLRNRVNSVRTPLYFLFEQTPIAQTVTHATIICTINPYASRTHLRHQPVIFHQPICVTNRLFFMNPFASPTGYFSRSHLRHQLVTFHESICVNNAFFIQETHLRHQPVCFVLSCLGQQYRRQRGPDGARWARGCRRPGPALDSIERLVGVTLE